MTAPSTLLVPSCSSSAAPSGGRVSRLRARFRAVVRLIAAANDGRVPF